MTHSTQGPVTPLRQRMIEDMRLSGLSARTQQVYIDGVRGLAAHYKRSPDLLTEEDVRSYLLDLRDRGAARGTFKTNHYGIRFLYCQTLNRDWALFGKKRFGNPSRSGCRKRCPMTRFAGSLAA